MTASVAISVRDVGVRIGRATLVDHVSLEVRAGEVVALVGPNGAGKSTLLSVIAGDRVPSTGTIKLAGHDVARMSPRELAGHRAVLRQRSTLTAAFTALEVVRLGQPGPDPGLAMRCLTIVGLAALADRTYPSLSGGEQQRVQLARVLAQLESSPAMAMLVDEPATALDLRHQQLVERVVRDCAQRGHPVILVSHDLASVMRCADRVAVLREGMLEADGVPAAVLTDAFVTRAFDLDPGLDAG